jgi:ribonuclease D
MYKISISPEEIEKYELAAFPGEIQVIDCEGEAFKKAVSFLRRQKVLGFDTETRPVFSPDQPHHPVALLQLSGPGKAFLFRLMHLGIPQSLCDILSNPDILKIGAAVGDDVHGLQKIQPFEAHGFVDLQKMVWEYGIRDKSVKKMSAIILGVRISKTQQLSNWEAEILSEPQCKYAATDAWVCREMYFRLKRAKKHPLTPEQINPQQAAAAASNPAKKKSDTKPAADASNPAPKPKNASGKRRHRAGKHHRKKVQTAPSGQNPAPKTEAAQASAAAKRKRHRHKRRRKGTAGEGAGSPAPAAATKSSEN